MNEKTTEHAEWKIEFSWYDSATRHAVSLTLRAYVAEPSQPMAVLSGMADRYRVPLDKCTVASTERTGNGYSVTCE